MPGPVCYGLGGDEPTLTDANLLLGYLNQHALLGGAPADRPRLRPRRRSRARSPTRSGSTLEEAAYGVHRIGVANMVRVVRAVSSERGRDPRGFSLVAFGGNGPVHAAAVAAELAMRRVIVPPCARPVQRLRPAGRRRRAHHFSRTVLRAARRADRTTLERVFGELEADAPRRSGRGGYTRPARATWSGSVDLRYVGQSFELRLPLEPDAPVTEPCSLRLSERFGAEHERTYGHRAADDPIELVNSARGRDRSRPTHRARSGRRAPRQRIARSAAAEPHGATSARARLARHAGPRPRPTLDSTPRRAR